MTLYQPYMILKEEQRRLLCFLAYTGKRTDDKTQALYRRSENLTADEMKKLVVGLRRFYDTSFYSYRNEYGLHAYHVAPLLLYMLESSGVSPQAAPSQSGKVTLYPPLSGVKTAGYEYFAISALQ